MVQLGDCKYTYNASGIRTSKIVNGIKTKFFLNGNKILAQDDGNKIYYHYGADGIAGFTLKLSDTIIYEYTYKKNIQGDIIGIYDSNNVLICKYIYDAWGNHKTLILSNNGEYIDISSTSDYTNINSNYIFIANLNPFRYRGYYFDTETGLYYLNSRYYDPELGRFINADAIDNIDTENLNGFNLYMYCADNPVMHIDENGDAWWNWLISGLQIVAGVVLCATGVGVGLGTSLVFGGTLGIVGQIAGERVSQVIGGFGSIANGWGAISTGLSLFSFGWVGAIIGMVLIGTGATTIAFGVNDVVAGIIGTNYIQQFTGMSDAAYTAWNLGLNIASSIGSILGRLSMRNIGSIQSNRAKIKFRPYGKISTGKNIYYYDGNGNPYWSVHNINSLVDHTQKGMHWHMSLGRDGDHIYSFIKLIFKMIFRR